LQIESPEIEIEFDKEVFNDVYLPTYNFQGRHLLLYGGAGSGKSEWAAQKLLLRLINEDNHRFLFVRKIARTIRDSQFQLFKEIISRWGLTKYFKVNKSEMDICFLPKDNWLISSGLDDSEKLKSITAITGMWLEEASEFERNDFKQLNLRLRGQYNNYLQIMYSFNPIDDDLDLFKHFFEKQLPFDSGYDRLQLYDGGQLGVLKTTYKDNKFIDEQYKIELEKYQSEDDYFYNVYALGNWTALNVTGRIYKKFDDESILKTNWVYDPNLPIILCCDFNVVPMKWALIQNYKGEDYVFDEIVKTDTQTEDMAKEFLHRYPTKNVRVYGDYSGNSRNTRNRSTDYDIIRTVLGLQQSDFFTKFNPVITARVNAVNWRLCNDMGKRHLFISPKCEHVIKDFRRVIWQEGRKIENQSGTNKDLTHISSAIGYYIEYEYSLKGKSIFRQQ